MNNRIPVYVLTGFLGSGKTTILKRMLLHLKEQGKKPALILNELGAVNVEKELFKDETMIELLNGCICCTIQDDMRHELQQFLESREAIDVLLIEGTGIANPEEIVESLTHPDLIQRVELQSVIGLIDASRYLEYQSLFQSSKEIRQMLKKQVTASSLLIINKTDLTSEKTLAKVTAKIDGVKNNRTEMIFSSYGEVDHDVLFKPTFSTSSMTLNERGNEHHHHHHHHPFQAIMIEQTNPVNQNQFTRWLKNQSETLLRAKGYITFEDAPTSYAFQFASGQLSLEPLEGKREGIVILLGAGLEEEPIRKSYNVYMKSEMGMVE